MNLWKRLTNTNWLKSNNIVVTAIILGIGIALSIVNYNIGYNSANLLTIEKFESSSKIYSDIIQERIKNEIKNSEILASFDNINLEMFETISNYFIQTTEITQVYSYVPKIYDVDRLDFEYNQSLYWYPIINRNVEIISRDVNNNLVRSPQKEFYYPVTLINPVKGNEVAVLFDLYSERNRKNTIINTIKYNETEVTSRIKLVQEIEDTYSTIIISPIVGGDIITTVLRFNFLLKSIFKNNINNNKGVIVTLYDETSNDFLGSIKLDDNIILTKNEFDEFEFEFEWSESFKIGQKIWSIRTYTTDEFIKIPLNETVTTTILITLVFISMTIFYIVLIYNIDKKHIYTKKQLRASYNRWMGYICHSIRGPIHTINFLTETLLDLEKNGKTDHHRLKMLQANTNQLFDLVNSYIDFTTLDKRDVVIVNRSVDICHVAENVFHEFTIMSSDSVKMNKNISSDLIGIHLYIDSLRFRQILSNALSNSVKFTLKGSITMEIKSQETYIIFIIKDTGPGLKGHDEDKLFEDYQQGDYPAKPIEKNTASSGLGLSISSYLAEAMGGTVTLKNRTYCRGSEFTLSLPFVPVDPSDPSSSDKSSSSSCKHPKLFSDLIICACEDDFSNRQVLREMLLSFGILKDSIIIFADGEELLEYIKNGQKVPHIILLDIFMKRLNGDHLQKELRKIGYTKPIVAVTGNVYNINDYINDGFDLVLEKPYKKEQLKSIIKKLLKI